MIAEQLPLALDPPLRATFESFWPGPNGAPLAALREQAAQPEGRWLTLGGPIGAGKSHLLAATARASRGGLLLSGARLRQVASPADLRDIGTPPLLCLDDLDALLGSPTWEEALFALLEGQWRTRRGLLVAARGGASELAPGLPDLASRLRRGVHWRLQRLDDGDKAELLGRRAGAMGLELDPAAIAYMLARLPRDVGALLTGLERVAAASLARKRRVTRRLIGEVLPVAEPAAEQDPGPAPEEGDR